MLIQAPPSSIWEAMPRAIASDSGVADARARRCRRARRVPSAFSAITAAASLWPTERATSSASRATLAASAKRDWSIRFFASCDMTRPLGLGSSPGRRSASRSRERVILLVPAPERLAEALQGEAPPARARPRCPPPARAPGSKPLRAGHRPGQVSAARRSSTLAEAGELFRIVDAFPIPSARSKSARASS